MKIKLHFLTLWIVADLNQESGRELLKNGLEFVKSTSGVRLTFIPNTDKPDILSNKRDMNALVWATLNTFEGVEATDKALTLLSLDEVKNFDVSADIRGFLPAAELHLKMLRVYCQRVLSLKSGKSAVVSNGKIFGPLSAKEVFTTDDFSLLDKMNQQQYIGKVKT